VASAHKLNASINYSNMPEKPPFPARPARQYPSLQQITKLTTEFQNPRARLSSNILQMAKDSLSLDALTLRDHLTLEISASPISYTIPTMTRTLSQQE
jgi:hypothetical protein